MHDEGLRKELRDAIASYDYPAVVFDFQRDDEVNMVSALICRVPQPRTKHSLIEPPAPANS